MPRLNGLEAGRQLRKEVAHIPGATMRAGAFRKYQVMRSAG